MSGSHFTHNGTSLFYTLSNPSPSNKNASAAVAPPTILLLHGWTCDSLDWSFQLPSLLALGFRVLTLDFRGHGRSDPTSAPANTNSTLYSPSALAADAAALLTHLDITTPVIVTGHSLGALVAAIVAVEHGPSRVCGLILVDAAYYLDASAVVGLLAAMREKDADRAAETVAQMMQTGGLYNERTPEWLKTWHQLRMWGLRPDVVATVAEELYGREDSAGLWENAHGYLRKGLGAEREDGVPRLAVVSDDWKVDVEGKIGLHLARGDKVEVMKEGHWLHQQDAERFNEIVKGWLEERGFLP
ncbi:alpha beta hydrolase [Diplodia corticola]|uniref:Alpha beta hydrolase n=1 Tax=Diplodia corticola TaxID=236234 RepID=A0A1J9SAB8_9PEZI|nr:alpha beta hydrolase [Diplodia corticola]OJD36828.1 alpha beta hydrolase [Diplodia corticola]